MNKKLIGAGLMYEICDDDHIHLTFVGDDGERLLSVTFDIEDWLGLADAIDDELEIKLAEEEAVEAVKH